MKILAVGDIVGEAGVRKLKEELPKIKKEENIDFVITNGENSAGGMGITEKNFRDILEAGTNVITMGNHTWGKKDKEELERKRAEDKAEWMKIREQDRKEDEERANRNVEHITNILYSFQSSVENMYLDNRRRIERLEKKLKIAN